MASIVPRDREDILTPPHRWWLTQHQAEVPTLRVEAARRYLWLLPAPLRPSQQAMPWGRYAVSGSSRHLLLVASGTQFC